MSYGHLCSRVPTAQVLDVEDVQRTLGHELLRFLPNYVLLQRHYWKETVARSSHRGKLSVVFSYPLAAVHLQEARQGCYSEGGTKIALTIATAINRRNVENGQIYLRTLKNPTA